MEEYGDDDSPNQNNNFVIDKKDLIESKNNINNNLNS